MEKGGLKQILVIDLSQENKLFSIVNGLDDMKEEVTEAVDKMTENIKKIL